MRLAGVTLSIVRPSPSLSPSATPHETGRVRGRRLDVVFVLRNARREGSAISNHPSSPLASASTGTVRGQAKVSAYSAHARARAPDPSHGLPLPPTTPGLCIHSKTNSNLTVTISFYQKY